MTQFIKVKSLLYEVITLN